MKVKLRRKLRGRGGESVIEVLASMLVITLGLTILFEAIISGARINATMAEPLAVHSDTKQMTVRTNRVDPGSPDAESDILTVTISNSTGSSARYDRTSTQVGGLYYYD